jgi:Permuted papain-like amidase enzyme, YaeF/YiiX, C92 family
MAKVERYGPGEEAKDLVPGDFILAHRNHVIARFISLAQKRRFQGADAVFAHWSHSALVVEKDGALVEAEITGVRQNPISRYRAGEYHLVRLGSEFSAEGRSRAVAYSKEQVGQGFGFLDMFGASLYLLFGWPVRLARRGHEICSGLVVRALQAGGQAAQLDPLLTLPADLAKLYDVRP